MYGIYRYIYISRVYMIWFDYHSYVMIIIVIVVIIVVVVVVVVIIIVVVVVSFSGLKLNWSMQFWGIQEKHSWLVTSSGTCFSWNWTCLPQESHFSPTTILMYRKQQARQPVLSPGSEQKLDWQETVDHALNPRSLLLNSIQWADVGSVQDGSFAFICYVLCFCIFEVAMARSWELGLGMKFQAEFQIESISVLLQADQETWIGLGFINGELSMIGPTGADALTWQRWDSTTLDDNIHWTILNLRMVCLWGHRAETFQARGVDGWFPQIADGKTLLPCASLAQSSSKFTSWLQ